MKRTKFKCVFCGCITDISYHTKKRKTEEARKTIRLTKDITYLCPSCEYNEWYLLKEGKENEIH